MENDILYFLEDSDESEPKLEIPASMKEEIFEACHDDVFSGQFGLAKTLARV
uniref:Integrase zinc-binding domain-containing protein n=1 Tax=Romanomermis culicivorax TaxID=13658 RepID=A0A915I4R2_ROMCU